MAEKKTAAKGYQKFKADLAASTLGEVYIFCGERIISLTSVLPTTT